MKMGEEINTTKKSITKNYLYNLAYQLFLMITPLVSMPYVARILGEEGSGQFSFAYSLVTYFTLFAALGFGYYAQRLIASHSNDKHQQSIDFWEIIIARIIPVSISLLIYFVLIVSNVYQGVYNQLMLIFSISVFAVAFDIAFLFQGNEEFGKLIARNLIIKTIGIVCIFVFVKKASDLWLYAVIDVASTLISNISMWVFVPSLTERVSIREIKAFRHLPSTIVLFLPTIAVSVYTTLDKTLIGLITKDATENGNYEYAERIVKMALTVVTSLGTVIIPRNSKKIAEGKIEEVIENVYKSISFVFMLGVPIMLGLISIAKSFAPWFFGNGYDKIPLLIIILAPLIIIIGLSNVFGLQFLIPYKKDKYFTVSIIVGALTNVILNVVLILFLKSYGAAIATIVAESVVTLTMYMFIKKDIKVREIAKNCWKYLLSGLIMFIPCFVLSYILPAKIWGTLVIVLVGVITYFAMILLLKDKFFLNIVKTIKNRLLKNNDSNKISNK